MHSKLVIEQLFHALEQEAVFRFKTLLSKIYSTSFGTYQISVPNTGYRELTSLFRKEGVSLEQIFSFEEIPCTNNFHQNQFLWLIDKEVLVYVIENNGGLRVEIGFEEDFRGLAFEISDWLQILADRNKSSIGKVHLLTAQFGNLELEAVSLKNTHVQIEHYYNDETILFYNQIIDLLKSKDESGMLFLYGAPGTGKTSFIRHIINEIDKKVIFVPNELISTLSKPEFLSFLLEHKQSIIVLEDAEDALTDRNSIRSKSVSTLLNLSDGLLSDVLGIQIICTFNVNVNKVDQAFFRSGRTIGIHEFKKLSIEKTNDLYRHLGIEKQANQEMTLAEITNGSNQHDIKNRIGF